MEIRESRPIDRSAIEALYPAAFPDEDLLPIVRALFATESGVLSLAGMTDAVLVGHVVFTCCDIDSRENIAALLGPLAVSPDHQREGIGRALIYEGFRKLRNTSVRQVHVLGDPAYYGRFGFEPCNTVEPPYELPDDWQGAWQATCLYENERVLNGRLGVPECWRDRSLWAP